MGLKDTFHFESKGDSRIKKNMNNKKYDLKKVSKVAVATLFLLFCLWILAWPQIGSQHIRNCYNFVFEVAVLFKACIIWCAHVNREKKGLTTVGGSFVVCDTCKR